jgi:hypothetical protein
MGPLQERRVAVRGADHYAPVPTLSREERKTHEQDHILELIEEATEAGGSKEAVVEQWMKVNGKKKSVRPAECIWKAL